jgi:hypothetical protein
MNNVKAFVHTNRVNVAVLLFVLFAFVIHYMQPAMLYNDDGSFREFGVGYLHKTVFPIWLVILLLSIFSYYSVLYYLAYM